MVAFWPHGLPVLIINVTMTLKFKFKKDELELKFFGVYNFLVKREKGSKGERGQMQGRLTRFLEKAE